MFSERLKVLRENFIMENGEKMTQDDLAKLLGYNSKSTVSQWESGGREPDFETLKKIAKIFSCTTDYLLGITNKPDVASVGTYKKLYRDQLTPEEVAVLDDENGTAIIKLAAESASEGLTLEEFKEILQVAIKIKKAP